MKNQYPAYQKPAMVFLLIALVLFCSRNVNAQNISTFAGTGVGGFSGDGGAATAAEFNWPSSILIDHAGNVFISDCNNNRIRMINPAGIITEIAGNGTAGFSGDGGPATLASLHGPNGLAMDPAGNLYVCDRSNHIVRKISPAIGGTITTIAGTPTVSGYSGDGGQATAAKFYWTFGLAFDSHQNLFITDQHNHAARKIAAGTNIITTIAGNGTPAYGGDGGVATAALLYDPNFILIDAHDNIIFSDNGNQRIRKINTGDTISTIAGNGTIGWTGDEGPATNAEIQYPAGLKLDGSGNLYFCDAYNYRIRKIDNSGIIHEVAGNGVAASLGDGGPATAAELNVPNDLALNAAGNILIAEQHGNRIRIINEPSLQTQTPDNLNRGDLTIFPNPNTGTFTITVPSAGNDKALVSITDVVGKKVGEYIIDANKPVEIVLNIIPGVYFVQAAAGDKLYNRRVVITR